MIFGSEDLSSEILAICPNLKQLDREMTHLQRHTKASEANYLREAGTIPFEIIT